jgi:hypothetical protein
MNVLFIAPMPNPINGQSKTSLMVLRSLDLNSNVKIVNINKKSLKNGFNSITRLFEIFIIFFKVWKSKKTADVIYISIAESLRGNLRDLVIYTICFFSRKKIIIHLLGGASLIKILNSKGLLGRINRYFIAEFAAVIVEGETNFSEFKKIIPERKIHNDFAKKLVAFVLIPVIFLGLFFIVYSYFFIKN